MKSEINHYNITNPDGVNGAKYSENKIFYTNDDPHAIKEDSAIGQSEWDNSVSEDISFDNTNKTSSGPKIDSVSSSSATSTATSSISSVAGSTMGAVAGMVAASVTTAVIMVVAFISTLTVKLSLVMATMNSLVFQLEFSGVTEQDYEIPMYAVLENNNGYYYEKQINLDDLFITFEDLESGTEYIITIRNEEKVYEKKSYFTATESSDYANIFASIEKNQVSVNIECDLKKGQYYTISAIDDRNNIIFSKDFIKNEVYSFEYKEGGSIYFTLLIDGKARAFYELNIDNAIPEYDFDNPIWRWNSDHTTAILFFEDKHGGEPFTVEAEVSRVQDVLHVTYTATAIYGSETYRDTYEYNLEAEYDFDNPIWDWNSDYTKATLSFEEVHGAEPIVVEAEINDEYIAPECESAGKTIYYATAMYNDIEYETEQELVVEATGHDYGNPEYDWIGNDDDGYTVVATFHCANDSQHTEIIEAEVNKEEEGNHVTYTATVEFEGKTYTDTYEYDIVSGSSAQLSLRDGKVFINTNGYSNQESGLSNPTEFVSSSTNPYLIQDEEIDWCDNIINVYQTDENILTADIYIKLKDVTIEAGSWCSLFRIVARNTLNVHLIIEGNVTFVGGQGQQIFSSQGNYSPTVNIIIDQTSLGGTFNAEITSGLTYAQTGTISVNYV